MSNTSGKELQAKQKSEVSASAEQTTPGAVFSPAVDIYETEKEIHLMADLPGVKPDDLNIDLRDGVLTLNGNVTPWENSEENDLLIEYEIGRFYRQFTISEVIDQGKIDAQLTDGVLKLTLPKAESAIPRQIPVSAG